VRILQKSERAKELQMLQLPFKSETKCPEMTLCAIGHKKRCQVVAGCLEEPELLTINGTQQFSTLNTANTTVTFGWPDWFKWPDFSYPLRIATGVIAAILIGAVLLFCMACLVTLRGR
jgi:hypothetical protein